MGSGRIMWIIETTETVGTLGTPRAMGTLGAVRAIGTMGALGTIRNVGTIGPNYLQPGPHSQRTSIDRAALGSSGL